MNRDGLLAIRAQLADETLFALQRGAGVDDVADMLRYADRVDRQLDELDNPPPSVERRQLIATERGHLVGG